jgi:hypothetical protein
MAITRFDSILKLRRCPDELTIKIIEAADAGIDQLNDEIIKHLVDCQSCRLMLEDYIMISHDIFSEETELISDSFDSILVFSVDSISKQQNQSALNQKMLFRGAASKSEKKADINHFTIATESGPVEGEISRNNDYVNISLSNINGDDIYYMIKYGDTNRINSTYSIDKVIFTDITPGIYILAEDKHKKIFKVIIIKV